ncbi:basic phospholipase A2-like [Scyliorhinus canicula]|uniref:basic phospholipase A2-like n=1 Tax=Scyliorhinus canicula TaxID=7830 RepID=UPI0018F684E7|nr:basic phospholipase A2-like [Scyliorhinus canicula]
MRQTSITRRKREVMESPKLTAILIVLGAIWIPARGLTSGRSMINFQRTVDCVNPSLPYQDYRNYGCFCRVGVNGNQPVDEIDRCCQVHHDCLGEVEMMGCPHILMWYHSTCENGIPKCKNVWKVYDRRGCIQKVCDCDIAAALCLKENSDKRNPKFVDYDQSLCKTVP